MIMSKQVHVINFIMYAYQLFQNGISLSSMLCVSAIVFSFESTSNSSMGLITPWSAMEDMVTGWLCTERSCFFLLLVRMTITSLSI